MNADLTKLIDIAWSEVVYHSDRHKAAEDRLTLIADSSPEAAHAVAMLYVKK